MHNKYRIVRCVVDCQSSRGLGREMMVLVYIGVRTLDAGVGYRDTTVSRPDTCDPRRHTAQRLIPSSRLPAKGLTGKRCVGDLKALSQNHRGGICPLKRGDEVGRLISAQDSMPRNRLVVRIAEVCSSTIPCSVNGEALLFPYVPRIRVEIHHDEFDNVVELGAGFKDSFSSVVYAGLSPHPVVTVLSRRALLALCILSQFS